MCDTVGVGRVTRPPQSLPLTCVGDLPRIPTMITSPEMGSAPQLGDPTQCLGKGLEKQQLMGAHQSSSLPLVPPTSAPLTPTCHSHPVCQDKLEKENAEKQAPSQTLLQAAFVCHLPMALHFGGPSLGYCSIFKRLSLQHFAAFWG